MKYPITVWRFEDAPYHLQNLSTNGGDEDWIAEVPPHLISEWVNWLESDQFGCCANLVYEHPLRPGWQVRIGCHA